MGHLKIPNSCIKYQPISSFQTHTSFLAHQKKIDWNLTWCCYICFQKCDAGYRWKKISLYTKLSIVHWAQTRFNKCPQIFLLFFFTGCSSSVITSECPSGLFFILWSLTFYLCVMYHTQLCPCTNWLMWPGRSIRAMTSEPGKSKYKTSANITLISWECKQKWLQEAIE